MLHDGTYEVMRRKSDFPEKGPRFTPWLFSYSWERRKLGEVSYVRTGFPFDSSKFSEDGEFLVITNGNIQDDNPTVDNLVGNRINVHDARIKEQYVLDIGDILITMDGTVGRTAKVAHDQLILAQRVGRLTANCSSEFLYQSLNTGAFFDAMTTLSHGGTIKHISLSEISDYELKIPACEAEQIAIGSFFDYIDRLITLHQREFINFFRFESASPPCFPITWEQRKFGEIVAQYSDPVNTPSDGYYRLGIRSHAKGTFHSYVRPGMELETAQMHRVGANNFIVNITFAWEHAVAITTEEDAGKLVSHRFPQFSFSEGMVPSYFKYLILDENFRHHLWLASPGGAGRNRVLKISEMLDFSFWVTSEEEQQKIAIFLSRLDTLITLHQRESTHTKPNTNIC